MGAVGRRHTSDRAMSEAVAQNDISKPGCTTTSGSITRMISAASASERRLIACRSIRIAANATEAVIAARRAGIGQRGRTGERERGCERETHRTSGHHHT